MDGYDGGFDGYDVGYDKGMMWNMTYIGDMVIDVANA